MSMIGHNGGMSFAQKWLNRISIVWQYVYETRLAVWLSWYAWWLWWPLYWGVKRNNIRFVINISQGTGQVLPELDNFLHRLKLGAHEQRRYVWLRVVTDFSRACVRLYGHYFWFAAASNVLYDLCLPMILHWPDITLDAGMAGLTWQLPTDTRYVPPRPWATHLVALSKEVPLAQWKDYYRIRAQDTDYYPLRSAAADSLAPDNPLRTFLGSATQNLALVHIKENVMNATAHITDPGTYLPALAYLADQRYRLVFVGREHMPEAFKQFDMLNYANSSIASFAHDLQLFAIAKLAITGGSGIAWIADVLGTPTLYLNSWHLFMPPFQKDCVFVPTLVQKKTGEYLTFTEQYRLYRSTPADRGDVFPIETHAPRNASADEILTSLKELISLMTHPAPLSDLQEKYRQLGREGWVEYAQSRISSDFVKKHKNLLA